MTAIGRQENVRVIPRFLIRTFWVLHRTAYRVTGGRFGLTRPEAGGKFGMMRLATVGRRSRKPRIAIVGYIEDGPNLVTIAMNGWGESEPAWWLNLQSSPDAVVGLPDGPRAVRARAATGPERERLWAKFRDYQGWGEDLDALSARRPMETAVVVFEPRADGEGLAERLGVPDPGREGPVDHIPAASRATRTESPSRLRLRLRHLWIVPALAIMLYASGQAEHLRVGILPLLVFGIVPDLPRLLGLGRSHAHGQMAARAVPAFYLMHHPLPPIALLALAAIGVVPPALHVGALAWLGHIVFGLAIGDRPRRRDGNLPPLLTFGRGARQDRMSEAGAPPAESAA
jgi:deazaflavin-dependent oxidoreductase (nitroreductase family)